LDGFHQLPLSLGLPKCRVRKALGLGCSWNKGIDSDGSLGDIRRPQRLDGHPKEIFSS